MKSRILIVEDEKMLSEAYELILGTHGYTTKVAHDGGQALKILESYSPDLILLDLRMPHINGIEFLHRYNASQHTKTKIIVFSNLDSQAEIDQAYSLGADRYILKAWASPKELLKLVADTLSEKTKQRSSKKAAH